MKFSIGDPVFVVSNKEEGVLIDFIGKDMACIKVGSSTYHAYLADLEHPYLRWFLEKKKQTTPVQYVDQLVTDKKYTKHASLNEGFYLGFMPEYVLEGMDEQVKKVKVYFFNESDHILQVSYVCRNQQESVFQLETELQLCTNFYVHDLSFEQLSTNPEFEFQFQDDRNPRLYLEISISLKPKKLFQYLDKIQFENKPIFHVPVFDFLREPERKEFMVHAVGGKNEEKTPSFFDFEKARKEQRYEVDLHIEKLVANWRTLSPGTMLEVQRTACQKALELAISTHQERMVFIHGMGSGRLKKEIHSILNQTKGVYKFVSDYDTRYGYGATEVFFQS
jgi:hypothetical protein